MRILVLVGFGGVTGELLRKTAAVAGPARGRVTLLHVACPDADFEGGELRKDFSRLGIACELHRRHRELQGACRTLRSLGLDADWRMVRCRSTRGNVVPKLLAELSRLQPELIVLGSPRRGTLHRLVHGCTTDSVVRKSRCPVLLVPDTGRPDSQDPDAAPDRAGVAAGA